MLRTLLVALFLALASAFVAPASVAAGRSAIMMKAGGKNMGTWGERIAPQKPGLKGNPLFEYKVCMDTRDANWALAGAGGDVEVMADLMHCHWHFGRWVVRRERATRMLPRTRSVSHGRMEHSGSRHTWPPTLRTPPNHPALTLGPITPPGWRPRARRRPRLWHHRFRAEGVESHKPRQLLQGRHAEEEVSAMLLRRTRAARRGPAAPIALN